ncbi:MAG: magnesium/cobalt transporter CorA [Desulfobaccales bacterium]
MAKLVKKRSQKTGLPPGTLLYTGERPGKDVEITITRYNAQDYKETKQKTFRECPFGPDAGHVTWINVNGLHQVSDLETLGGCYRLHPLVLEDILNPDQRPKVEVYGNYLYITLKMLHLQGETEELLSEQVNIILGENLVISLQDDDEAIFEPVRQRLKASKGRIRGEGADYLAYCLLDLIVDHYFVILERLGEVIEDLETELVTNPTPATLNRIHHLKRDMIMLRKSIWPVREVISQLERQESPLIREGTTLYLKDLYDHIIQVIDHIETFRDILAGMLDIYLSSISNRLNEIMKMLTMIATIFIPLTFIAGVYGMNFKHMPELEWEWGYFSVLLIMGLVFFGMILYFRRKGWLGGKAGVLGMPAGRP